MRLVGVLAVATVVGCTLDFSSKHGRDAAVDAVVIPPPDACPAPKAVPLGLCVTGGIAALAIDGTWHLTGTSSYGLGSNATTSAVDQYMTIQRYGCQFGMGSGSAVPPVNPFTFVSDTYLAYECSYYAPCPRGMETWTICVYADGQLHYADHAYGYQMGTEWTRSVDGVLAR